jgi:protein phosphatase
MPGDRYLICSDGLSGVVTEQTLHQALSSVRDPDKAALQLVELALKGGGPDNITCIVADVVDALAGTIPPSRTPVMAGAASAGPPVQMRSAARQNSPAGRARQLRKTAPQVALPDDEDDPRWADTHADARNGSRADDGDFGDRADMTYHHIPVRPTGNPYRHPAAPPDGTAARSTPARRGGPDDDDDDGGWIPNRHAGRRRWPIVTTLLVVLVLALGIGGFVSYQWVQGKYYLGPQNGDVAIFQGINSSVAGISLSSPYQNTGVPLDQLSASDQGAIRATVGYNDLKSAQQVVNMLKTQAATCHTEWNQLVSWQQQDATYQQNLGHWVHLPTKQQAKTPRPTFTVVQPKTPDTGTCAPASAFGILAAQLPPGTTNTTPASATSHNAPAPSANASPSGSASKAAPTRTATSGTTRPAATSSTTKK